MIYIFLDLINFMNLFKKIAFYGLITLSFNSLSCKKESPVEAVNDKDYLKPLLGTWHQTEQNNSKAESLVKKIFKDDKSYTFSVEDTVNRDFRAFRAVIDEIADAKIIRHI